MKILIVEDCNEIRELIAEYLSEFYAVETASNGLEAWEKLNQSDEEYILVVDYMMPIMNGLELLNRILESNRKIKGAIMNSCNDEARFKCEHIGMEFVTKGTHFTFFEKPFAISRLEWAIRYIARENSSPAATLLQLA